MNEYREMAESTIAKIVHYSTMHGLSSRLPVEMPPHVDRKEFLMTLHDVAKKCAHDARDEYLITKKRSWKYLISGFIFLIFCLLVGHVSNLLLGGSLGIGKIIEESATVAGWVGMWRPVEMFLYELPELRDKQKMYDEIYHHVSHVAEA